MLSLLHRYTVGGAFSTLNENQEILLKTTKIGLLVNKQNPNKKTHVFKVPIPSSRISTAISMLLCCYGLVQVNILDWRHQLH